MGKVLNHHHTFPISKWEKSFSSCFYHCCLSVPSTRKHISPQSQNGVSRGKTLAWMPFLPTSNVVDPNTECVRLGTVHSGFLYFLSTDEDYFWRPSAYLDSCLLYINAILMPLKYESMPKITFCFIKDYLEEIKHFQFSQCFETLVYLLCWCAFL